MGRCGGPDCPETDMFPYEIGDCLPTKKISSYNRMCCNARGDMVYCLPPELGMPTAKSPLKQLVLDIVHNNVMVIIRTSPGAAQLIARLLDSLSKKDGVLGTIAGDDTIFIAPADVTKIEDLRQRVEDLFENV